MKTRIRTRMKTRACIIRRKTPAGAYLGEICRRSKALRNTTNFYIRNTYTGIVKSPEERTHNETEVLHFVFTGIRTSGRRGRQAAFPATRQCAGP